MLIPSSPRGKAMLREVPSVLSVGRKRVLLICTQCHTAIYYAHPYVRISTPSSNARRQQDTLIQSTDITSTSNSSRILV